MPQAAEDTECSAARSIAIKTLARFTRFYPDAAREMIKDGLFEQFPMDAVFGMHNWPGMAVGKFAVSPGPVMASTSDFKIVIRGKGSHAALPHNGIDPVPIIVAFLAFIPAVGAVAYSALNDTRSEPCFIAREWLGDDTINPAVSEADRNKLTSLMVRRLQECAA